jgi:paired amphipathic helix protein Sin3a
MMPTQPPTYHAPQPPQKMELHDAFAYLDRVKAEFTEQPDVYNRFLQIMREFKANA